MDLSLIRPIIQSALREDIGRGDITSQAIAPSSLTGKACIIAEEEGILAGIEVAKEVFRLTSGEKVEFISQLKDKDSLKGGLPVLILQTSALAILKGERVALNFLGRLSGIATLTKEYVDLASPFGTKILDTRKTTPNLRVLEKYAVKIGGGLNHRFGLDSGILIKDNHIRICGSLKKAVERIRQAIPPFWKIEVEADGLSEVKEAVELGVEAIMLDNMGLKEIKKAVDLIRQQAKEIIIEASGGINLENVAEVAKSGVDLISVGSLTKAAKNLNMHLEIMKP
ncbi:carboxylating nicotinate-nucleotide diphosphorylase [Candidatus Aerophobetes bacterium]|uniref:Probable nicotinate-nucleotide pyrophosphorylase [carboxylating] n=2 Tax=root TaxID=1 RepID=A0A523YPI3_UNCAE|nr:MAG: carboxylating nicotinate-nucleotide diphosphorylase [Candidatus Aerophobetes bacterium]